MPSLTEIATTEARKSHRGEMLVKPIDLIRSDLGEEIWDQCTVRTLSSGELSVVEELSPFPSSKTYLVSGKTGLFDFPTLPHGSYCVYVADVQSAIRLTRAGKEIESVLKMNWSTLQECNPVVLANLILKFYDGASRSSHRVLQNVDALRSLGTDYVLDDGEVAKVLGRLGNTQTVRLDDAVVIRAVTLCGWMHDKGNLGIEYIRISPSGRVQLDERAVFSKRVFKSVPQIRY